MKTLSTKEWVAVGVGIAVVTIVFFFPQYLGFGRPPASSLPAAVTSTSQNEAQTNNSPITNPTPPMQNATQLSFTDTVVGTGAEAKLGSNVAVHYTGMFTNGKVFDSSVPRGQPLTFKLGEPGLIEGFTQGTLGMKVGGKRTVIIPPSLGYGSVDYNGIPANSTLIFELELVDAK